jgi:hypothetical protein
VYENIGLPSEGLVPVMKNKKWGFADMNGKLRIGCSYAAAGSFVNGFSKIKARNLSGMINRAGVLVVPPEYEDIQMKNNLFVVTNNGKTGLISSGGATLLPCLYNKLEFISDKIISATLNDNLLYLNFQTGKIIWKAQE